MNHLLKPFWIALVLGLATLGTYSAAESRDEVIVSYPKKIDANCRGGKAKLYDECGDQLVLFKNALEYSRSVNKVLLVSYGAEWCIWCHVFDAYLRGQKDEYTYTVGSPNTDDKDTYTIYEKSKFDATKEAAELKSYAAKNFVLLHLDYRYAQNGNKVLALTKSESHHTGGVPFIFTVTQDGVFADSFNWKTAETRRDGEDWYRGYDRSDLMRQLVKMHVAALPRK